MSNTEQQLIDARLANNILRDALRRAIEERDRLRAELDELREESRAFGPPPMPSDEVMAEINRYLRKP